MRGERARPRDETIAFGLMAAMALIAARFWPFERWPLVTCPMRALLHAPCPTCGMTRAFVRTMHGELLAALRVSPLGTLAALAALTLAAYLLLRLTVLDRGVRLQLSAGESTWLARGLLALVAANWLYLASSGAAG